MTHRRCRGISAPAQEQVRAEIFASARHVTTSSTGADMKKLVLAGLVAALAFPSSAFAQGGAGASRTGSSIDSSGTGGTTGAGASGLNTSSDNNGGGANAPAKSSTTRPGDNDTRQTQGGQQAMPGSGSTGANRK
jgi:hypothetical protein